MVIITKSIILNHSLVYTLCTTLQQFTFSKLAAKVSTVLQCCMHIGFENVFLLPLLRVEASSSVTQTYTDMTVRITSINDHSSENRLHSSSFSFQSKLSFIKVISIILRQIAVISHCYNACQKYLEHQYRFKIYGAGDFVARL